MAGKAARNRAFDLPNISPLTRDESAAKVGCLHNGVGRSIPRRDYGQVTHIKRAGQVTNANIERHGQRMVTNVRRVMTGTASTRDMRIPEIVIQSGNACYINTL
jgi:hypothetical protein